MLDKSDRGPWPRCAAANCNRHLRDVAGIAFEVPAALVKEYKDDYSIDLEAASGETHQILEAAHARAQ